MKGQILPRTSNTLLAGVHAGVGVQVNPPFQINNIHSLSRLHLK